MDRCFAPDQCFRHDPHYFDIRATKQPWAFLVFGSTRRRMPTKDSF